MTTSSHPPAAPFDLSASEFSGRAIELFRFQYAHNQLYREYCDALGAGPKTVARIEDIPFLPVSFFKTHAVRTGEFVPEAVFESSGTTGVVTSRHAVRDLGLYRTSCMAGFERFYGPVSEWCVVGLLPAYLERSHSSLVYMVNELITASGHPDSGFYLYEHGALAEMLLRLEAAAQKTWLIGVTFALLDFAANYRLGLRHTVVIETGGMKGRRKEITRQELHNVVMDRFGVPAVHAEYGMTELLSQAYSAGQGLFRCPAWMRVLVRDEDDPLSVRVRGEGLINIIDLANVWSCAFLATDDIGSVDADGRFTVMGRVDNSDIRGCSLMVAS